MSRNDDTLWFWRDWPNGQEKRHAHVYSMTENNKTVFGLCSYIAGKTAVVKGAEEKIPKTMPKCPACISLKFTEAKERILAG